MVSIAKYAGTLSQTTGGNYASGFTLEELSTKGAMSVVTVAGKNSSPNKPSIVSLTNFGFNLPTGAEITKITVNYLHGGIGMSAPTISLLGVTGFTNKGSTPLNQIPSGTLYQVSWNSPNISRAEVNSTNFGVKFDYPSNNSTSTGYLGLGDISISIEYKVAEYTVQLKKVTGGYNEQPYTISASISNVSLTSFNPTCTITVPNGFTFTNADGAGTFTDNGNTITWNPKLSKNVGTSTASLTFDTSVTFPDEDTNYNGTFTLTEALLGTTTSYNAIIYHTPGGEGSETEEGTAAITDNIITNLEFVKAVIDSEIPVYTTASLDGVAFTFPVNGENQPVLNEEDTPVEYYVNNGWHDGTTYENSDYEAYPSGQHIYESFKFSSPGRYVTRVYTPVDSSTSYSDYEDITPKTLILFEIRPSKQSLTTPNYTILTLTDEEINRLGSGFDYVLQTYLKQVTSDSYPRDWYTNNRVGVFNNSISGVSDYSSLTSEQIYDNTTYWSDSLTTVNGYESLECEFTYNEDYPLKIIITGDYTEAITYGFDTGKVSFTEPCIIEKTVYQGREQTGNYPVPIMNLLSTDSTSNITLPSGAVSTNVRLYGFPENNNTSYAIRGIMVTGAIQYTDNLVLNCKIETSNGRIGQRSIILTSDDNGTDFTIGGLGDLWGFSILTLQDLGEWELDFSTSNILSKDNAQLTLNSVNVTFYIEQVETQEISAYVNDENLAYYGAFIEEIKIPEGLKTDTKFLTIDGTDTNDAYRQNIREKEIEIKFNISECDLKTSTDMLRQVTKLLLNKKDQYNRPIPNTIRFSHYPDDYFEYIIESTLEVTPEITGYNVTAKLTIPSGTSYALEDTVTNTVGYANGLAAVNPIITLQPSDSNIEVQETLTGQSFNMGYTDWNNKIVSIDCQDRKVYLKNDDEDEGIDISKYVDHNSDWFRLEGEYSFEGVNCIIRTVTFTERW